MKQYNNGQRKSSMYGGGMAMPRKPMMMGGLAEKNTTQGSAPPKTQHAMGRMTQQKKFDMGYNLGGAIKKFEKKKDGGKLVGGQNKLDKNKDGRISGEDFKLMRKS